jgi:prepilin-type N-terminal cleavage/methylation domain-containing protein
MMRRGFTLLETVMAIAIFATVIAMAMGGWLQFIFKANRANTQAELDMDVRKVIERFRFEMRNSARETIIFYPEGAEPYAALGFALPSDQDGDGLMDTEGSNIVWRQTAIYHLWNHSPNQMRRTVFSNRKQDASYDDRYDQIAAVVTAGTGGNACLDGESAKTTVLFENLFTGRLWHAESRFDGYAEQADTVERLSFGSLPLGPGAHTLTFTIVGGHPSATGRKLRLDRVSAGPAGWPFEAELCTASGGNGAAPAFVGQGLASAAYGLVAPTAADGDTLSLTVYNDAIEECLFVGEGRNVSFSNTVVRFDAACTPTGFAQGVQVAKLDGQFKTAWWGSVQADMDANPDQLGRDASGSLDTMFQPATNCLIRIPIFGTYVRANGFGPIFRVYKSAYNYGLNIFDPAYAVTTNYHTPNIDADTPLTRLAFFQNGIQKASWASCAAGGVDLRPVRPLDPVYAGQGFIFSCRMTTSNPGVDGIRAFDIKIGTGTWDCWIVQGGTTALAMQQDWSGTGYQPLRRSLWYGAWRPILPGLVCMTVNYADAGVYISHAYDTMSEAPKRFEWVVDKPAGATFTMYARSGHVLAADGFDIADAMTWDQVVAATSGDTFIENTGRYVQFRTVYTAQPARKYPNDPDQAGIGSAGPYRSNTPRLRRARFTWDGPEKYVDIAADVLKSPDCGIFKVDVDGHDLVQGVTMDIEIFKDARIPGGRKQRLRSVMSAEVDPRNSGK